MTIFSIDGRQPGPAPHRSAQPPVRKPARSRDLCARRFRSSSHMSTCAAQLCGPVREALVRAVLCSLPTKGSTARTGGHSATKPRRRPPPHPRRFSTRTETYPNRTTRPGRLILVAL